MLKGKPFCSFIFLLLFLASLYPARPAYSIDQETKAIELAKPASVLIVTKLSAQVFHPSYSKDKTPVEAFQLGSGFVVNPDGYIVTNAHVINEWQDVKDGRYFPIERYSPLLKKYAYMTGVSVSLIMLAFASGELGILDYKAEVYVVPEGRPLSFDSLVPARPVDFVVAEQSDLALLKGPMSNMPSVILVDSSEIRPDDQALAIGYPGGVDFGKEVKATVTSVRVRSIGFSPWRNVPAVEIESVTEPPIRPGSSGSMVIDLEGKVMGVVVESAAANIEGAVGKVHFLTQAHLVKELLRRNSVENRLGPADLLYREGLELFWKGDYQGSAEKLSQVLGLFPDHSEVQRYLSVAQEQLEAEIRKELPTAVTSSPEGQTAVGAAVFLAILGVTGFLAYKYFKRRMETKIKLPSSSS